VDNLWQEFEGLLTKQSLQESDQDYFIPKPYYRSVEGELCSDFETLKNLWKLRRVSNSVRLIERKNHLIYYQIITNNNQTLFGKIVVEGRLIKYIYENILDVDKKRYFCVISYDGSNFEGYQKQLNKRTIQGTLEDALKNVFNEETQVHASGRTDKGVHAYHQTIHFDGDTKVPLKNLKMVIKQYLPEDIDLKSIEEKPPIFHARYDAIEKTYMYHIDFGSYDVTNRNYRWYVAPFDIVLFKEALYDVVGVHDFSSFTKTTEKNAIRKIIDVSFEESATELKVYLKGNGFLRYMARNLIMAAYLISSKELTMSMKELLRSKDNTLLRHIASPSGLYLFDVSYD